MRDEQNEFLGRSGWRRQEAEQALNDDQWQAVADNDSSRDGEFLYAVRTTGIFCKPSCKSRLPNRLNTCWFPAVEEALAAGYRACKRCRPAGEAMSDDQWIAAAQNYIRRWHAEKLTLERLAGAMHASSFHFHRTFRRVAGLTPIDYLRQVRIEAAQKLLVSTDLSISAIGARCGLDNAPYFITLFKKWTGSTPAAYRRNTDPLKEEYDYGSQK